MSAPDGATPGWFADPFGRFESRYWDGNSWTEHVQTGGRPGIDAPAATTPGRIDLAKRIPEAVPSTTTTVKTTITGLLDSPTLVVKQRTKLIEVNAEFDIYTPDGRRLGMVQEVGKTLLGKALSFTGLGGDDGKHRLQVTDSDGAIVMTFLRPEKFFRSKLIVESADGREIGRITQKSFGFLSGRERFVLESGKERLGSIHAQGQAAWNFSIRDAAGDEVAHVTRTWSGQLVEMFTNSDNYVVSIHRQLTMPMSALVVAAALALDLALRQGEA